MNVFLADGTNIKKIVDQNQIIIEIEETSNTTYLEASWNTNFSWDGSEYVLFPSCCYAGNQFEVSKKNYPPFFSKEEAKLDMPVTITDVPRLEKDGSGIIEVTTGDVSVPCIGVFSKKEKKGILLFTIQEYDEINFGLVYEQGEMKIRWPYYREKAAYRWPFMVESIDEKHQFTQGERIVIPYKLFEFSCETIEGFYRKFFENRKCMNQSQEKPIIMPFEQQWEIQRDKFNYQNWYWSKGFYGRTTKEEKRERVWQPGWCGGAPTAYAMLKLGGMLEEKRAISTLGYLFDTQKECGFFVEAADKDGNEIKNTYDKNDEGSKNWHLLRESGDGLYFILKSFEVLKEKKIEIPSYFKEGAEKLADAFMKLWNDYGQFGQFIDLETGELVVGGSTSVGIVSAALCKAYQWYQKEEYLEVAKKAGIQYYNRDAINGYTTGGPGEILQGVDSESCAGLLESYVVLYEVTKEQHWLQKAKYLANMLSSWVMPYNYRFPSTSEFGRLGKCTIGSVFANIQNKHSAPGLCTLSGDSIYRLYIYTGEMLYKELFEDIVLTVSQYMSTEECPIYSWDVPKDASLLNDDTIVAEREKLPMGYICERVNTSDWESLRCIGGVFNGSCWCETTNLLILAECMDILKERRF